MAGSYVQVDAWIRAAEGDDPPAKRTVLGFAVDPESRRPVDPFPQLLARIDAAAVPYRRARTGRHGGCYSGRRAALMRDRELAEAVHQLCLAEGVTSIRTALEMSRQSLQDVWVAHGMKPPGRIAPRRFPKGVHR